MLPDIEETSNRISIIDKKKCKPKKCNHECQKFCPVNRQGKNCVTIKKKAQIAENLCIGCNICTKKCPFDAIKVINLPFDPKNFIFQYSSNGFKVHKLFTPKKNSIVGLLGSNGLGKTTLLKLILGKIIKNKEEFLNKINNKELKKFIEDVYQNKYSIIAKRQNIYKCQRKIFDKKFYKKDIIEYLELKELLEYDSERKKKLSGGEIQRLVIGYIASQDKDIYIFDEISNYLDLDQRIKVSHIIRNLSSKNKYVIVVDHDLTVLDYVSDYIYCLYGVSSAYCSISPIHTTKNGINVFLKGYDKINNIRFRENKLTFSDTYQSEYPENDKVSYDYPEFKIQYQDFHLNSSKGRIYNSEITVLLGKNGSGKSSFLKTFKKNMKDYLKISYKPQNIKTKYKGTVESLFSKKIGNYRENEIYYNTVVRKSGINKLLQMNLKNLSEGQKQLVFICLTLGTNADLYILDEPSANLDVNLRYKVSKIIKKYLLKTNKTALIVDHDINMIKYLADKTIIFSNNQASQPISSQEGINQYFKSLNITSRKDPENNRISINKLNSRLDIDQKSQNKYIK